MTITNLDPRLQEIGRIRSGTTKPRRGKPPLPVKLDTWRLTSSNLEAITAASVAWGGEVKEWKADRGGAKGYELITETACLPVIVPPQDLARGQYLEHYSGGGIVRRCDSETELISGDPCMCATETEQLCKPTTHLKVLLPTIPGIGSWRLTSLGWNAANELAASVEILNRLGDRWVDTVAELELEQRTKVTGGKTHHYGVPVLRLPYSLAEVGIGSREAVPSLPPGRPSELPPEGTTPEASAGVQDGVDAAPEEVPAGTSLPATSASSGWRFPVKASDCDHSVGTIVAEGIERCVACGMPRDRWAA